MTTEQNGPRLVTGGLTTTQSLRSCDMANSHFATPTTACREFLGRSMGRCSESAIDGDHCPAHRDAREAWHGRSRT